MDDDVDLSRYTAALRRRRSVIGAVALVGAVAGLVLGLTSDHSSTVRLQMVPRLAVLSTAGADTAQFEFAGAESIVSDLSTKTAEQQLGAAVGAEVDITAVLDRTATSSTTAALALPSVVLTVASGSAADVDAALDLAIERGRDEYAAALSASLTDVRAAAVARGQTAEGRLDDIQAQLDSAGDEQTTLIEGLLLQAGQQETIIDQVGAFLVAIDAYEKGGRDDVRILGRDDPEQTRGPVKLAVAGMFAALVLAAGAVLALTAFDRSIRTRRDLRRIGLGDLLAVLPRRPGPAAVRSTAMAIEAAARAADGTSVQVVPVVRGVGVGAIASLGEHLSTATLTVHDAPGADPAATEHAATAALTVVAVRWGRDQRHEVARVANELAAAGAQHVAVLLHDVPPGDVARVEV